MISKEKMLEREASFWDSHAEKLLVDDKMANKHLAFDSPAAEIADRLPRLRVTLQQELADVSGKRVLVYGCGNDSAAVWFSKSGAIVDAIDISPKSVLNQKLVAEHLNLKINAIVMDAHDLKLPSGEYDIVYGNAILHHLQLQEAIPEIARVLKPDGKAIFRDVMSGNIFLRAFRWATPFWRTPDEHPLVSSDFDLFTHKFSKCQITQYILTGLPYHFFVRIMNNVILKKMGIKSRIPLSPSIYNAFDKLDYFLFRFMPFLKSQAWICLVIMKK